MGQDASNDTAQPDAPDLDAGSQGQRVALTIPATSVSGTHATLPVLIKTSNEVLQSYYANQLRFFGADGEELAFQIEDFNRGSGRIHAWVRVPNVSDTADATFYIHLYSDAQNAQNSQPVWEEYAAVWHLDDRFDATPPVIRDATANTNHGEALNGTTSGNGISGRCAIFDGVDDRIEFRDAPSLRPADQVTLSAWVNPVVTDVTGNIVSKPAIAVGPSNNDSWQLYLSSERTVQTVMSTSGQLQGFGGQQISNDAWHHVALVYDGAQVTFVINGVLEVVGTASGAFDYTSDPVLIGQELDGTNWVGRFAGLIDEVRIAPVALSVERLETEFSNQSDPESFVLWGVPEPL